MKKRYSVGFLIPKDANRFLGEDGWEFESKSRLPPKTELLLKHNFSLCESTSDYSSYEGSGIKIDVFKDENGEIENAYFRFYSGIPPDFPSFLRDSEYFKDLDFFIP